MYTVLFKKDLHSIVECLRKLGHLPNIYSEKRNKLGVLSAQLQISVAYFCSIGLYFLV